MASEQRRAGGSDSPSSSDSVTSSSSGSSGSSLSSDDPNWPNEKCNFKLSRALSSLSSEAFHQRELARYLRNHRTDSPLFTAPCNGIESSAKAKRKAKDMGMENGVPDLVFFEPRAHYLGLAIELKRPKGGSVSTTQQQWIRRLRERGWDASVEYGARRALRRIRNYLNLPRVLAPEVTDTQRIMPTETAD